MAYPGYNNYNSSSYPTHPHSVQGYTSTDRYGGDKYKDRARGGGDRYDRYETKSVDRLGRDGYERDRAHGRDGYERDRAYGRDKTPPPYYTGREGGLPPTPGGQYPITSQPTKMKAGFPGQSGEGPRQWSTGMFDCTKDVKTCMCVWCCTPFFQCSKMEEFGEHCCSAWPCFLGSTGSMLMLRYKMRAEENIEGSMIEDCLMSTVCYPCMACQVFRENDIIQRDRYKNDRSLAARMESRAAESYSNNGYPNRY